MMILQVPSRLWVLRFFFSFHFHVLSHFAFYSLPWWDLHLPFWVLRSHMWGVKSGCLLPWRQKQVLWENWGSIPVQGSENQQGALPKPVYSLRIFHGDTFWLQKDWKSEGSGFQLGRRHTRCCLSTCCALFTPIQPWTLSLRLVRKTWVELFSFPFLWILWPISHIFNTDPFHLDNDLNIMRAFSYIISFDIYYYFLGSKIFWNIVWGRDIRKTKPTPKKDPTPKKAR